jgi:hypothetical protein
MDCQLCRGIDADEELSRVQIWDDDQWRLTTSLSSGPGRTYLEPKRHVPQLGDLDEAEAVSFGTVLAYLTRTLAEETGAERVAVELPAEPPHLRIQLSYPEDGSPDELARRLRSRLEHDPPLPPAPMVLLPYPPPKPRSFPPDDPEIPPLFPEPPDEPWPKRPAHDPWF